MKTLSFTNDMYTSILNDIKNNPQYETSTVSRMSTTLFGIQIVFAVSKFNFHRSLCLQVDDGTNIASLPRWNGINIDLLKIPEYSASFYVRLEQGNESDAEIFEIVASDIVLDFQKVKDIKSTYAELTQTLAKWKLFFSYSSDINMPPYKQQGLYGELLFLEEAIKRHGAAAVHCWTGPDAETHDFYFGSNAVEIKTTSSKAPYTVTISSEYQLDNNDISGELFLIFFSLHKSKVAGEKLPMIFSRLETTLSTNIDALNDFRVKLLKYGYIDTHAELYQYGFSVRERQQYWVKDGFPRITSQMLPPSIGSVTYSLSLSSCSNFLVEQEMIDKMT